MAPIEPLAYRTRIAVIETEVRLFPHRIRRERSQPTALRIESQASLRVGPCKPNPKPLSIATGACATAPLAPTAFFASRTYARGLAVQHLVSQIAVVSRRMASLHSLTSLVGRRTVQLPPADHSRGSRLSLMPYLIFV
jgi:hypothetical protein